jgi:glutathione S-transferase
VPTLHVQAPAEGIDTYLIESGPIVEFLTELYPSHLTPHTGSPNANAVAHWRQRFFVDTWFSKINPLLFKMTGGADETARTAMAEDILGLIEKEAEPLLQDGKPFFGGSEKITVVEVALLCRSRGNRTDLSRPWLCLSLYLCTTSATTLCGRLCYWRKGKR